MHPAVSAIITVILYLVLAYIIIAVGGMLGLPSVFCNIAAGLVVLFGVLVGVGAASGPRL